MRLNREIELDEKEVVEIENILILGSTTDRDIVKSKLHNWITRKLQEAFDFGYNEGRKSNE